MIWKQSIFFSVNNACAYLLPAGTAPLVRKQIEFYNGLICYYDTCHLANTLKIDIPGIVKYENWWFMRYPSCPTRFHISIFQFSTFKHVARGCAVGWGTALQAWWVRFPIMSLEFFIAVILPAALWPSASNRNEHQEYFLVVKGAGT